jgi:hypothetical protein
VQPGAKSKDVLRSKVTNVVTPVREFKKQKLAGKPHWNQTPDPRGQ